MEMPRETREPKRLLLGTTNQAKVHLVRAFLEPLPIDVLSLEDVGIAIDVVEDGSTPQENAERKARAYYSAAGLPTLAIDAGLHVAGFPDELQPGVRVRRMRGVEGEASDQEMLRRYAAVLDECGGESRGVWDVSLVLVAAATRVFSRDYTFEVVLISRPSSVLLPGAPLSSLMTGPDGGRYFSEMPPRGRPDAPYILEFVAQHLNEL
jgi:XTP/dITP diphosphohydrolase